MIIAPANLPPPVLAKLNTDIRAALQNPTVVDRHKTLGAGIVLNSPDEMRAFVQAEMDKWAAVTVGGDPAAVGRSKGALPPSSYPYQRATALWNAIPWFRGRVRGAWRRIPACASGRARSRPSRRASTLVAAEAVAAAIDVDLDAWLRGADRGHIGHRDGGVGLAEMQLHGAARRCLAAAMPPPYQPDAAENALVRVAPCQVTVPPQQ